MRCITIQNKEVYNILKQTGTYRASLKRVFSLNLKEPYQLMMKEYNWTSAPIFLVPEGYNAEFCGAKFKNGIAIELDIPDELIKVQCYYNWSDLIYFLENPNDFEENIPMEEWIKEILNIDINKITDEAVQVTVEYLKKEWIIDTSEDIFKIKDMHDNSGGACILRPLEEYKVKELTEEIKTIILNKLHNGEIKTDSDIEDLVDEYNLRYNEVEFVINLELAKGTPCEKCKHINSRFYNSPDYPCNKCSRINEVKDYYESIE